MEKMQKTAQYSPWNPGFAAYGTHSETHLIPPESPIASLVCQFYEITGCGEQALLSAIPDGCHDFIFVYSPESCLPIRKHRIAEIADFLRMREEVP